MTKKRIPNIFEFGELWKPSCPEGWSGGESYYDLFEVEMRDGEVLHFPVPIVGQIVGLNRLIRLSALCSEPPVERTDEFFKCPICGEPSFYAGVCGPCEWQLEEGEEVDPERQQMYEDWLKNQSRRQRRKARIEKILARTGLWPTTVRKVRYIYNRGR